MKYYPKLKICFAGFESKDQYVLKGLKQSIVKSGSKYSDINGFSYDDFIKKPEVTADIRVALNEASCFINTGNELFNFLLEQKANSIESKLVIKKIDELTQSFAEALKTINPDLVIIPEDFRALHGGLAADLAKKHQLPFLVLSPLYYELISARPAMGGLANTPKIHTTSFYATRSDQNCLKRRTWPAAFQAAVTDYKRPSQDILATLQNNETDASVLWLLARTASKRHPISVKFHPDTPAYKRQKWRCQYRGSQLTFFDDEPIENLLPGKKAFATVSSSTLFQALRCEVPVILIKTGAFPLACADFVNYYSCFPVVQTPDEMTRQLEELSDECEVVRILERQKVLKEECFSEATPELTFNDLLKFVTQSSNQNLSTV